MRGDFILFMAPMAGVTNRVFRNIVRESGADYVCSEMISVQGLINKNPKTFCLLDLEKDEPAGIQLFGREPEDFVKAAEIIKEKISPLFFDINMGCPVPKIVKGGMGAALLREPKRAAEIVSSLVKEVREPVTVKTRLGWETGKKNGLEVALRCEDAGATWITIHGRTRDQFYSGCADWDEISSIANKLQVPVIANGDVFSPEDAFRLEKKTGCRRIMLARGALGNPWIFKQIKKQEKGEKGFYPGKKEIMQIVEKHLEGLINLRGSKTRAIIEFRKHLGWYVRGLPRAREIRHRLMQVKNPDEVITVMENYLGQIEEEGS